jgi:hypothetical protein
MDLMNKGRLVPRAINSLIGALALGVVAMSGCSGPEADPKAELARKEAFDAQNEALAKSASKASKIKGTVPKSIKGRGAVGPAPE